MTVVVERQMSNDIILIRTTETGETLATRLRRNGRYIWQSGDPDIQAICDEWGPGSTAEAIAGVIANHLRIGPTPEMTG